MKRKLPEAEKEHTKCKQKKSTIMCNEKKSTCSAIIENKICCRLKKSRNAVCKTPCWLLLAIYFSVLNSYKDTF